MIPNIFIENWAKTVKWQTSAQIEQDLMISRALIDFYNDPHINCSRQFCRTFLSNLSKLNQLQC